MSHLTINGITFPGEADSFSETGEFIGDVTGRAQNGTLLESRTTRKRRWNVRSTFLTASDAEAWRIMLEGGGQHFALATNAISTKGAGPASGGAYSFSTFSPPQGSMGCVTVNNGSTISWELGGVMGPRWTPAQGYTISVYRQNSTALSDGTTGFYRYLLTGSTTWTLGTATPPGVTQWRDGTTGSFNVGRWLSLSSTGRLVLAGFGDSAPSAGATHSYAMLTVLPFATPLAWQSELVAYTDARRLALLPWISEAPRVVLGGDAIPEAAGVDVVARVQSADQRNVRLAGAHRNNARILTVEFIEV